MSNKPETTQELNLVRFRGEYFPLAIRDWQLLNSRSLAVARISESSLQILKKTLLKGVKISFQPWATVYEQLLERFKDSFSADFAFDNAENWMLIRSEKNSQADKELSTRIALLVRYCGRYGFRIAYMTKNRKDYNLTRLMFVPDKEVVPALHFNEGDLVDTPVELKFNLSPSCRVRFTKRKSPSGIPSLNVVFEDRFKDTWSETFSRGFNFSEIKKSDCDAAIGFFVALASFSNLK